MSVGTNIKKRRFELRMSQQELANAMGYKTRSTIAKIESGENDVSQKKLQRFAAILDTTAEALISGAPAALPNTDATEPETSRRKHVAVILAGGKSGKNHQNIPSQYLNVHGKPIIVYSMEAYQQHPAIDSIYVVCTKSWENIIRAYSRQYNITKLRGLIPAGSTGILSLKNAVNHLRHSYNPSDLVLIQEATRPLVSADTISSLLHACAQRDSATICHSMRDYVQFDTTGSSAKYVDRNNIIALQSPEAHTLELLIGLFKRAGLQHHPMTETNCTMLLYNLGYPIHFVESSVNNIKISREEDIATLSATLASKTLFQ